MCSIMGYCSGDADFSLFKAGFDKTLSRGPDDSRIVDTGHGLLGFHRLSIMGLEPSGMQPFALDGSYVVCNGEIYGFEALKRELLAKGYSFRSESDCEVRKHSCLKARSTSGCFAMFVIHTRCRFRSAYRKADTFMKTGNMPEKQVLCLLSLTLKKPL